MKKGLLLMIISIIAVSLTMVSAGIYFSQPESYYNVGDIIKTEATVSPVSEGFLKVDLVCGSGTVNVFNGIPKDGTVSIEFPLTFFYIKENSGKCYFSGEYAGANGNSREFEISKSLNVLLDIENLVAKPGEGIVVSGSAKRLNGQGIKGDVEISIPLLKLVTTETSSNETLNESLNETESENTSEKNTAYEISDQGIFYGKVVDGKFSVNFSLNKDIPAGDYRIDVKAHEQDSTGKITSEGLAMANLQVSQLLTGIEVALNSQTIDPGTALEIRPILSDQTGNPIQDEVSVIITNEDQERVFEKIVKSDETFQYDIPSNLTAGYYEIEASSGGLNSVKTFYINEKAIADFKLINNTLIVTNIGNIPYKKDIQVDLNGKPFVKKVDLELGESQEFILTGDGDYDVKISDGEKEITAGIALTGHAVNVEAVQKGLIALNTPVVWIFFIIIIGAGLLFLFRNILKKKSFAFPLKGKIKERFSKKPVVGKLNEVERSKTPISGKAEQTLVLKGDKNKAAVLCIKLKNKLAKTSKKEFEKLIQPVYDKKGAVYYKEDSVIVIFSPLMTKSFKNEVIAAKAAESIKKNLQDYNSKFKEKIEFGIGIHSGEIVNKIEGGKLKFTALGNLISNVSRIANSSDGKILLTKNAFERAGNEIKAARNGDIYEVRRIIDSEKNKKFIDGFLKRAAMEDKKGSVDFFDNPVN